MRTSFVGRCLLGLSVLLTLNMPAATPTAAGEYDRFVSRIPDDANTLILLNVESIFASPLAQAEDWKQTYADNFAGTPLIVPPERSTLRPGRGH